MFQNVRPSRFWEDNLRQRYGFVGPRKAFTDKDCMFRAMGLFINFFESLQYGYGFLVTLYQSVLAVEHDQRMNDYGRAVLKRFKFLLKHSHCKHYGNVFFPDQVEYMLQRKTVLAMSLHSRLGKDSPFYLLDQYLTTTIINLSLNNDPFLAPTENYSSLPHRFAKLYAADWDDE
jgi:hypothetical protein